jgi:2-keto-4-pentenoate hydratase/2-oxohepta-3-ene-1,7-dioic acid hydratase in catechol pathway
MKIARFTVGSDTYRGRLEGDDIHLLDGKSNQSKFPLEEVRLLPPCEPSKVVAIGLNYRDHAEELHMALPTEPLLFLKPSTAVLGPGDSIILPPQSQWVDYEAELAVVIGKTARGVPVTKAADYILGYTCLNDVTARDLQAKDGQWTRAKGFDTFCPIGPWIETELDHKDLKIELFLNGTLKQVSRTSNLVFNPFELVAFISNIMTLLPGDVIATGTPSGIGPMAAGDAVEVRIEGIGGLFNLVGKKE